MVVSGMGGDFEKPKTGLTNAICVAVYDLKYQVTKFGPKHQVRIAFELDQRMSRGEYEGKRFVQSDQYTASIHPKSALGGHLNNWRGRPFTEVELKAFDLDNIIGVHCQLNLVENDGYVNIGTILGPSSEGKQMVVEGDYTVIPEWIQKKIDEGFDGPDTEGIVPAVERDDDIPF